MNFEFLLITDVGDKGDGVCFWGAAEHGRLILDGNLSLDEPESDISVYLLQACVRRSSVT